MSISKYLAVLAALVGCVPPFAPPSHETLAEDLETKTVALVEEPNELDGLLASLFGGPAPKPHVFCSGEWVSKIDILTANHCVRDQEPGDIVLYAMKGDITIGSDQQAVFHLRHARVEFRDAAHDLAMLLVGRAPPEHGIAVVAPGEPRVGQGAYSMSNPLGQTFSWSSGEVADIRYEDSGEGPQWYVQATTPISPGSSGSGLYDAWGRLIGVADWYVRGGENLNFFVHPDYVRAFLTSAAAPHAAP